MTFQILYSSRPVEPLGHISDLDILRISRRDNAAQNVTGFLLRTARHFAQILEGEEPIITRLFEKIARDHRHSDVTLWQSGHRPARQFAQWSMGYGRIPLTHTPESGPAWHDLIAQEARRQRRALNPAPPDKA